MSERDSRCELADFLKTRRARLAPELAGHGAVRHRRSPGLRREDVAALAGVGLSWYTRLEQGKPIRVSAAFLENLARALRLTEAERVHLFVLAQHRPPPLPKILAPAKAAAGLQSLLDAIDCPAYARNRRFDVVAWNAANTHMFGDFAKVPPAERNVLLLMFARSYHRRTMPSWEADARSLIAKFRLNFGQAADAPEFLTLVAALSEVSADFRRMWAEHDVSDLGEGVTRFLSPRHGGERVFRHQILMPEALPELRITMFVPVRGA